MLDKMKDSPEGLYTEQEMSLQMSGIHWITLLCQVIVRAFGVVRCGWFCNDAL